jgi:hypothetical protein
MVLGSVARMSEPSVFIRPFGRIRVSGSVESVIADGSQRLGNRASGCSPMGWLLTAQRRPCGEVWQACGGRGSGLAQAPLWEAPGWLAIDASGRMAQPMRAGARRTAVAVPSAATWRLRAPLVECLCRGIQRWSWQAGLHFGNPIRSRPRSSNRSFPLLGATDSPVTLRISRGVPISAIAT